MNKIFLCFFLFVLSASCFAQTQERILFIVDGIPVIDDPKNDEQPSNGDIDHIKIVTDTAQINEIGYKGKIDKIVYITTKAYLLRSDADKLIPSTKLMTRTNGLWQLNGSNTPYTGPFIDYFMNGSKEGEGTFKNGLIDGIRTVYFPNGNKRYFYTYANGIENGASEEYFRNGNLKQKGSFINKKEVGLWQIYYSTGKLKRESTFINNKQAISKEDEKFYAILDKGIILMREEEYDSAVKRLNDAEKLKQGYADLYFYRGTAKLDLLDFENALIDLNKAIEIEPLYMEAIANRAFTRLRKYQFKDSRTLSNNNQITVLAAKDKVLIPKDEQEKICADLNLAYSLGDDKKMILDAMKEYCK
ncbi:MAG: toxin-antitoxin system YwqK family antitoxin [Bacteroidota bacterium]